jgi:hydroxyacyl-ACP dehydratase HTD2-like protein with hotdog domain
LHIAHAHSLFAAPVVHGPLTALLLLEFLQYHKPKGTWISEFSYNATNPLYVNAPVTLHGAFTDESKMEATVWAKGEGEGVGMVAKGKLVNDGSRSL